MEFEWDSGKARTNKVKHRVSFDIAPAFDFATAVISIDDALSYGEERMVATGWIGAEMYTMVYVERGGVIRVISLRKATRTERETYADHC